MDNVMIFDHPLIQHKISILRNKATGTNEFRALIEEIAMLMGYEALRDLPVEDVEVETPIETCMTPMISGRKLAVVPIPVSYTHLLILATLIILSQDRDFGKYFLHIMYNIKTSFWSPHADHIPKHIEQHSIL